MKKKKKFERDYGKIMRADETFKKELRDIQMQKRDRISETAITKDISSHGLFKIIKQDIIRKKVKKGSLIDIFTWMIISFVLVLFFVGWLYAHNLVTQNMQNIGVVGDLNITETAENTFGSANLGLNVLKWASFVIIFAMALSIIISNLFVRAHPVFFAGYVLVTIIGIVASAIISNVYEKLLDNAVLGSKLAEFSGTNFIFLHLPIWVTIIGLIGGVTLFINFNTAEQGGGIE